MGAFGPLSKQTLNKYYKIMNENCISKEDFEKEKQELQNRILKMYGIGEDVDTSD
ncbi:XkdX family protein [Candidatus Ornithobacterium hominis]|nr:XkdX family protein [Candidatus Ornithobacterium hominis]